MFIIIIIIIISLFRKTEDKTTDSRDNYEDDKIIKNSNITTSITTLHFRIHSNRM